MISFKRIKKYSTYGSYQRIQKIKYKQATDRTSKKNCRRRTYQDYLNKKAGFECCKPARDCCYCISGFDASGNCLNPSTAICCLKPCTNTGIFDASGIGIAQPNRPTIGVQCLCD